MARVLKALHDRSMTTFRLSTVREITGLRPDLASSLLKKAVQRGLVTRLKPGLFVIVPQDFGSAGEYAGDPYLVGRDLAGEGRNFISHASAMEIHRMVTQPQLVVFVSSTKRIAKRIVHGTEYRFVLIKPEHFFGVTKHWVTKERAVEVSDLERTMLDGLRQPEYCGGVSEVAKGIWMRRADLRIDRLVDYAQRLNIGVVFRRLGYLLELYRLAPDPILKELQDHLTASYMVLDPTLPREGVHLARWRLHLNIPPAELKQIGGI